MTLKGAGGDLNPIRLTGLAANSVDYNKAPQHLHNVHKRHSTEPRVSKRHKNNAQSRSVE